MKKPVKKTVKKPKVMPALTFGLTGVVVKIDEVHAEMERIRAALYASEQRILTAEMARNICTNSGTHLIKLVSPRFSSESSSIIIDRSHEGLEAKLMPSVSSQTIPYAKALFRLIEIEGHETGSVIDHAMKQQAGGASAAVLMAFSDVFGADVLEAVMDNLHGKRVTPLTLTAENFPIVFLPSIHGDVQITPVSPASVFMGMKTEVAAPYYKKKPKVGEPKVAYGKWSEQEISAKPQNISGALHGTRKRFQAEMPEVMSHYDAEVYRFLKGGKFPKFRDHEIAGRIIEYMKLNATHEEVFSNMNIRRALDWHANGLINDTLIFIEDVFQSAKQVAEAHKFDLSENLRSKVPTTADLLFDRYWSKEDRGLVRQALTGVHFSRQQRLACSGAKS